MSSHVQPSSPTVATTSSNEVASKYRPCWGQLRSVGATCVSTSRKQSTQHHFMRSITSAGSPCGWKTTMLQKNNCFTEGCIFRMNPQDLEGLTMVNLSWKLQATNTSGCILVLWAGRASVSPVLSTQPTKTLVVSGETQNMKPSPKLCSSYWHKWHPAFEIWRLVPSRSSHAYP